MFLRLAIGAHFFCEGLDKLQNPKPFTAAFFGAAKGPFAPFYHHHVWDRDGLARFDAAQVEEAWKQTVTQAGQHYGYDTAQAEQASAALDRRLQAYKAYLEDQKDELDEYRKGLERHQRNLADPARTQVPALRGQTEKWETELKGKRGRWLAAVDGLANDLQRDLAAIATPEQRARGVAPQMKPGRRPFDSEAMDRYVPYFDLTIGILLVLGLAVRPAALAAAGFLAMVVSTQWPGTPGAMPVYYQTVECAATLVLAAVGAGRYCGVDSIIGYFCGSCCRTKDR